MHIEASRITSAARQVLSRALRHVRDTWGCFYGLRSLRVVAPLAVPERFSFFLLSLFPVSFFPLPFFPPIFITRATAVGRKLTATAGSRNPRNNDRVERVKGTYRSKEAGEKFQKRDNATRCRRKRLAVVEKLRVG